MLRTQVMERLGHLETRLKHLGCESLANELTHFENSPSVIAELEKLVSMAEASSKR